MLMTILSYAVAVIAGAVVALRYIAPKTKTTADDKALAVGEKVLETAEKVGFQVPKN